MPKQVVYIEKIATGEYLHTYSTDYNSCTWGTTLGALNYVTEPLAQDAIDQWDAQYRGGTRPTTLPLNP